jgi:hypothetical protein
VVRAATAVPFYTMERSDILQLLLAAARILASIFWPPIFPARPETAQDGAADLAQQTGNRPPLRFEF